MRMTPDFDFQLGENAEMMRANVARFADEQMLHCGRQSIVMITFHAKSSGGAWVNWVSTASQ